MRAVGCDETTKTPEVYFPGSLMVAGAGYAEYYTASETYWVDLI